MIENTGGSFSFRFTILPTADTIPASVPCSDSTNTKSLKAILCPFFFKNKTFLLALKLISAIQSSAICECISGVISDFSSVSQPLLQDEHPEPESPHAVQ